MTYKKPTKKFIKGLGELAIRDILMTLNKDKPDASKEVDNIL
jgi:hypothetical protein